MAALLEGNLLEKVKEVLKAIFQADNLQRLCYHRQFVEDAKSKAQTTAEELLQLFVEHKVITSKEYFAHKFIEISKEIDEPVELELIKRILPEMITPGELESDGELQGSGESDRETVSGEEEENLGFEQFGEEEAEEEEEEEEVFFSGNIEEE